MVLTSAADGSVKGFHCGLNVHPYLQEANTFDRMNVPIHKISATSKTSVSLSQESRYVVSSLMCQNQELWYFRTLWVFLSVWFPTAGSRTRFLCRPNAKLHNFQVNLAQTPNRMELAMPANDRLPSIAAPLIPSDSESEYSYYWNNKLTDTHTVMMPYLRCNLLPWNLRLQSMGISLGLFKEWECPILRLFLVKLYFLSVRPFVIPFTVLGLS